MNASRTRLFGALLAVMALAGCASGGSRESGGSSRSRNVITAEEIASANVNNVYQLVERLRPHFLRPRGPAEELVVYVDNIPVGGVRALGDVNISRVREVRFLDSREATQRFGAGHRSGAILVSTR
jgi:hypothetical protein